MATIALALDALLNRPEVPLQQAVAEHFSPSYRRRANGTWDEREGFVAHIAACFSASEFDWSRRFQSGLSSSTPVG